jgi:voltage-gated potassium channel
MTSRENERFGGVGRRMRDVSLPQNVVEKRMTKFMREPPSVRLAAGVIVSATVIIVVLGGVMMRVFDHTEYSSVWLGMWWVLQTVTTVGYGDFTPKALIGRILTSVVMLWGIAFLAIVTAAITSVFVARAEQERTVDQDAAAGHAFQRADDRLDRFEAQLTELAASTRRVDERIQQLQESLERSEPRRDG